MSARPIPPTSEVTAPYWDAARRGELVVQRCAACDERPFPPRARCPRCGAGSLAFAPVSGRGTVYSFTVAQRAPHPVFSGQLPLVVAIVELAEGPRLVTNVVGCDLASVTVGMPVEVAFKPIDDSELVLPVFTPIRA
jgi:uncharacterized OB-fold protein